MFRKPRIANGSQEETTAVIAYLILLARDPFCFQKVPRMFDRRMRASYAPYVTSGCCPSSTSRCILRSRDATLLCEFVIDMQSKSDTISNLKVIRYSVCGTAIFDDGSPMAPQLISRSRTASFEPCHCMCIGYFKAEEASEACVLSKIGCCMVNLNQREEAHKRI